MTGVNLNLPQAIALLVAVIGLTAFTAVVTWELSRQPPWYTLVGDTVVLSPHVGRIAPSSAWHALYNLALPDKFGALKVVLGSVPVSMMMQSADGAVNILQLAYTPDGGLTLTDVRRDETILRYDPDVGILVGAGIPDAAYLNWVQTDFRVHQPFQTPVLLVGSAHAEILNSLQLLSRVQLDSDTYVGRAHHIHSPAYSGLAVVRNQSSIFLADHGPVLINNVPWASVQANVDATAVVGGAVVTIDALQLDTGGASILDDPGDLVVTVRRWNSDATCTTFRNLNDAGILELLEPGEVLSANFIAALADLDPNSHELVLQAAVGTVFTLAPTSSTLCNMATGTINFEATATGVPPQPLTLETQPVMCSAAGWQVVCQGRNAFLSSVAA